MRFNMKCLLVVFVLVSLISFFIRDGYSGEPRGVTKDTIKIGIVGPLTGPVATEGVPYITGAKIYFRYINEVGGINGRKIKTIVEDDRYSIPLAIAAFKKLVYKDGVMALVGGGGTVGITALFKSIKKEKIPVISFSLAESMVKPQPQKRYIFIAGATYKGEEEVLMDYLMHDLSIKKPRIAYVYPDTTLGHECLGYFEERVGKYGIKLARKEVLNYGSIEATSQVLNIKRAKADYIVMGASITQNATVLLRGLRQYGLSTPVYGTFGSCSKDVVEIVGEAARNYYATSMLSSWYEEDAPGIKLMRRITKKYKIAEEKGFRSTTYVWGWLSAMIYAEGMKRAGKNLDGEALVDKIETLKNFDTGGLSGPLTYGKDKHYGSQYWRQHKADVEKKIMRPITDWRKPLELN